MDTKETKNEIISQNVQIRVHLDCLKNKTISKNVESLFNLGSVPKISRTSGYMNGDQNEAKNWDVYAKC